MQNHDTQGNRGNTVKEDNSTGDHPIADGRRNFLRNAAFGALATTVGGTSYACGPSPEQTAKTNANSKPAPAAADTSTPAAVKTPQVVAETWNEPWVWRPSDWPGQQLDLQVVENQNPGINVGLGNPGSVIFSFGGNTPGPTIRMKGDETLFVRLRNHLATNAGQTAVGPGPDAATLVPWLTKETVPYDWRQDFCLGEHTNGVHSEHTTNLHTHGLHVRPDRNPNGTHSDNVILRVTPQADLRRREQNAPDLAATCRFLGKETETYFLRGDETAGQADYEFRLGKVMGDPDQKHPPGTHWYHPHCHGATHNQVASGMAGFLIVEGDVDEAVNDYFTDRPDPDTTLKTGDFDYRERLMFMQRVNVGNVSKDPDSRNAALQATSALPFVNGSNNPPNILMRPGAVERWRVINGSVDGRGYKHFMVLKGRYEIQNGVLVQVLDDGKTKRVNLSDIEPYSGPSPKQQLWQLAFDGITLVNAKGKYYIEDLAQQNAGTKNPLAAPMQGNPNQALLNNLSNVFKSAENIRNTWVRPNEVYLGPANRTDVFFQAPDIDKHDYTAKPVEYTVIAKAALIHADTPLQNLQKAIQSNQTQPITPPTDVILAHLFVTGERVTAKFSIRDLQKALPSAPAYLQPVDKSELELTPAERAVKPDAKRYRTRTIRYSGVGAQGFPLMQAPADQIAKYPELDRLQYAASPSEDSQNAVFMTPNIRTMAINGRKFSPNDPKRPRAYVIIDEQQDGGHAAEEWVLFNESITLWGNVANTPPEERAPEPLGDPRSKQYRQPSYQFNAHYVSYPLQRKQGNAYFQENHDFQAVTRAIDHPFHQHQNPFWVMRIEIPDENGNLVNILAQPRWQDTVWIPRNGGRVVFRSRFPDFVGTWVNHCHILLHEDNGMMQVVQGTPIASEANYDTADAVAQGGLNNPNQTNKLYPPPDLKSMYRHSVAFVDPNHTTGQKFPLPSYFDKDDKLIEAMIPVPELPQS